MTGKIVIIIITTIITIIITNGNLCVNISSHTNREEKDRNWYWQYKIVEIVESGVARVDHIFENTFVKSLLFRKQRTVTVTASAKQQCLGISAL
ncbi:hypothetical protein ElyMa_000844000 [Elysia marginata]|uniref:Secreted protein n=1 Tax=Elysia marginata TaxID=1093978 RepID=A0AAV4H263_9GAST|nr:hypothetical protein ElyMa_000844000 [Elysia marginata]